MYTEYGREALADAAEVQAALARQGHYTVQIGSDRKAGTEWPVSLTLTYARGSGEYWITTDYFGSHHDGDGAVYTEFADAYAALCAYYDL